MHWSKKNISDLIANQRACSSSTAAGAAIATVAGSSESGTKVTGATIDRLVASSGSTPAVRYDSCVVAGSGLFTGADGETCTFAIEYQTSEDGSTWSSATSLDSVVLTAATGALNVSLNSEEGLLLSDKDQYIRVNVTPTLSAASADLAVWSFTVILGGATPLPV